METKRKSLGKRKNLKEELRRTQIKEAAINLFSSKGYNQATMDDIVIEAGISKSLIYWYWKSKSALLKELIDTCMQPYVDFLQELVDSKDPVLKKMNRLFWEFADLFRTNERLGKLVHFCSLHYSSKTEENFSDQVKDYYKKILDLLEKLIDQGIEDGIFKKDIDSPAMALFALSAIEGYVYMSILEDRMPLERVLISLCMKYVVPGIIVDSGDDKILLNNNK